MTRLFHFTDVWFYSTAQRESEVATQKGGKRQGRRREAQRKSERCITAPSVAAGLVCARKCMQSTAVVSVCVCVFMYLCDLHLSDGFRQVGGYFCQSLPSAVHYVVAAGAGLWAL